MGKKKDLVSKQDVEKAEKQVKKGLKSAFAIGCYNSEVDDEIGRSSQHAKHMRRTRRRNFATKMNLIDPHYGKKAAGILAAGTVLGLAATTVPAVGAALGPTVGGAVIAGGLAFLETDAHRAVGDHAILDSLLEDRDDNWRTNINTTGYNGHGDFFDPTSQQTIEWSDSDDEDLSNLLPPNLGGTNSEDFPDSEDFFPAPSSQKASAKSASDKNLASSMKILNLDDSNQKAASSSNNFNFFDSRESQDFFNIPPSASSSNKSSVPRPPSPVAQNNNFLFEMAFSSSAQPSSQSSVPRPPSPRGSNPGAPGQRFANPHTSPALQMMQNAQPTIQLQSPPPPAPVEDDFFNSLLQPVPLQPEKVKSTAPTDPSDIPEQISIRLEQQKKSTPQNNLLFPTAPTTVPQSSFPVSNSQPFQQPTAAPAPAKSNDFDFFAELSGSKPAATGGSFFSTVAAAIPPPTTDTFDPFADLYARR